MTITMTTNIFIMIIMLIKVIIIITIIIIIMMMIMINPYLILSLLLPHQVICVQKKGLSKCEPQHKIKSSMNAMVNVWISYIL